MAHRQELPTPPSSQRSGLVSQSITVTTPPRPTQQSDPSHPRASSEKLAPQTMEGLTVEGTRWTNTYPVGYFGNDHEFSTSYERWMSKELRVPVLFKSIDPRTGERRQSLTDISRDEPDPSLFQPPPDYTVVDEKGDFRIQWARTN